jgi:hypothetical protein
MPLGLTALTPLLQRVPSRNSCQRWQRLQKSKAIYNVCGASVRRHAHAFVRDKARMQSERDEDAKRWRERAELFRTKAREVEGEIAVQAFLGLADAWDRWAERAERGLQARGQ